MAASLLGMDREELAQVLGPSVPAYRSNQLFEALYRQRVWDLGVISVFPRELRRELEERARVEPPRIAAEFASGDGTRRYLLRLDDGKTVETVLMPEEERDTLCVSSQVGCPLDCRFCLTALMGFERNLGAGEIVGQVLVVAQRHELAPESRRLNLVLMGQGEPLLNLGNVIKATRILTDRRGVGMSEKRITLSTAGIIPKMAELGQEPVRPKLAISLNATTDRARCELMPITKKYPLADLLDACRAYPLRGWERLTFEYVLLGGINDSDEDARRLVRLVRNLRAKVNLLAWNPGPGMAFETPAAGRVEAFQRIVGRALPCFVRKPRGRDIYAACGQLKRMAEAWAAPPGLS